MSALAPRSLVAAVAQPAVAPAEADAEQRDEAFTITKLRDGTGPVVLFANGFLSEGETGWGNFEGLINTKYPQAPVCRVSWGAQQQISFVKWLLMNGLNFKEAFSDGFDFSKLKTSIAGNPWEVAKKNAEVAGKQLADEIMKTDAASRFVLVGHSLGGRLMTMAGLALGQQGDGARVEEMQLTGAAISRDHDWKLLNQSVTGAVHNYFSEHDPVLTALYGVAEGSPAVGRVGFDAGLPRINDHDFTSQVNGHSDYFSAVKLL